MKPIEVLLQGEAIADVQLITLAAEADLIHLLEVAEKLRGAITGEGAFHVFVQDQEKPLKPGGKLPKPKPGTPLCLHVHRCMKVKVEVSFNGKTKEVMLAPSHTVGGVTTYAAEKLFGMDPHDAAEHVLQLAGTTDRPDVDTHIGSLARHCQVAFDLVPLVRVEG